VIGSGAAWSAIFPCSAGKRNGTPRLPGNNFIMLASPVILDRDGVIVVPEFRDQRSFEGFCRRDTGRIVPAWNPEPALARESSPISG